MANIYVVEKTIKGKNYKAQFNGLSAFLEAMDDIYVDGTNNISLNKLTKYVLENVIVEPANLKADDFENYDELSEVVAWGRKVMQGTFRNKKDEKPTDKEGK